MQLCARLARIEVTVDQARRPARDFEAGPANFRGVHSQQTTISAERWLACGKPEQSSDEAQCDEAGTEKRAKMRSTLDPGATVGCQVPLNFRFA